LNAEVALDIGIKEEKESVSIYKSLVMKYKYHKLSDFFNKLLEDEKHHLLNWEKLQIEYVSTKSEQVGIPGTFQSYNFTSSDLVTVSEAVKYWGNYYPDFINKVKMLQNVESRETLLSIIKNGYEHLELIGNEYFRLKGSKPDKGSCSSDSCMDRPDNTDINNKEIVEQIVNEEKICLIRHYDWVRKCTNSQLKGILWKIMEDKYHHLKQWAKLDVS